MTKELLLSNQICFPFYAISRKITQIYTPYLNEIDLTYPQYLILLLLWEKNWILIKDICHKLFLETNTISPILNTLEKKDLILKKKKDWNNKETFIFLTKKWINLKKVAEKIPNELLNKFNFDEDFLKNLHSILWNFLDNIDS